MGGDDLRDEGVVERLTRELSEARKESLIANRALRSVVLEETLLSESDGKITVDQAQAIGRDFAALFLAMLQSADAANCLEWIVDHPTVGKFTLTLQRCNGKSPMELRNEARERYESSEKVLVSIADPDVSVDGSFDALKAHCAKYGVQWNANDQDHDSGATDGEAPANPIRQVEAASVCDEVSSLG